MGLTDILVKTIVKKGVNVLCDIIRPDAGPLVKGTFKAFDRLGEDCVAGI